MTGDSQALDSQLVQAAEQLRHAQTTGRPCPPVRDLIGSDGVDAAYAVQRRVASMQQISGARVVGRKLGLVAPSVQAQLGVAQPIVGTLMDSMQVEHHGVVPVRRLLQPKIEAEIAFRLAADLDTTDLSVEQAVEAVAEVYVVLEVVDSRIADWNISAADVIADNASAGLFVLAPEGLPLTGLDLRELPMSLRCDGVEVSSGYGRDNCMGDPVNGLVWLAREASRRGIPLLGGMLVLAGALGPMVPVREGQFFSATIGDLPGVDVHFRSSVATADERQVMT